MWAVPWTVDETIDVVFLATACIIVTAVPMFYVFKANLHDPLARAILAGTGVTALAFNVALGFSLAAHMGYVLPVEAGHWLARAVYAAVATGKFLLLLALISVLRNPKKN